MKRTVFAILIILSMAVSLWGGGRPEVSGVELTNKNIVEIKAGWTLKVHIPEEASNKGIRVYAQLLRMDDDYVMNQPETRMERDRDNRAVLDRSRNYKMEMPFLMPLINLDIFAFDGKLKSPIDDHGITVSVQVEWFVLEDIYMKTGRSFRGEPLIYTYDRGTKEWINLRDREAGMKIERTGSGYFWEFLITQWPSDDKMIACGG